MNSINFYSGDKFPMYRETLAKIQEIINSVASLALLGGERYILSGCQIKNEIASAGVVILNGEILPFAGGSIQPRVTIIENRKSVEALGVTYPEVYIERRVEFSITGEYDWSSFSPLNTNLELHNLIKNIKGDAPGTVKMWAGQIVKLPSDYKLCNGDELSVVEYPELFENLGVTFGGNGQTTFKLPDLRDRFIVGYNSLSTSDYNQIGKTGGQKEIALTKEQLPSHDHTTSNTSLFNKLSARAADVDATNTPSGVDSDASDTEYRVGGMSSMQWQDATIKSVGENKPHENRPPWFALAYIIKVK